MADPGSTDALEAALDELYGVDPADFVDTRKRLAAALRGAEEKDAAKSLLAARRPTTAAWALNQLSRRDPDVVHEFLDRNRELEAAQVGARTGDRDAMRDATKEQRRALAAVTDAALEGLGDKASDAFRTQIVSTLHAAGVDESVREQLRQGRLIRELSGSTGFPDGPNLTLVPDLAPERSPRPARTPKNQKPEKAEKPEKPAKAEATETAVKPQKRAPSSAARATPARDEQAEQRRAEIERRALEQSQRRIDDAEAAAETAQRHAETAEAAAVEARARVVRLHDDLEQARRDARTADDAAAKTRREATRLARAATRLRSKA